MPSANCQARVLVHLQSQSHHHHHPPTLFNINIKVQGQSPMSKLEKDHSHLTQHPPGRGPKVLKSKSPMVSWSKDQDTSNFIQYWIKYLFEWVGEFWA